RACASRSTVMGWITPSISTAITLGAAASNEPATSAARQTRLNMSDTPLLQVPCLLMSKVSQVDVLLFGAHPDDVEWGAGGIALLLRDARISFAIVDLTSGEMGSRGTLEHRQAEAAEASEFLGASA